MLLGRAAAGEAARLRPLGAPPRLCAPRRLARCAAAGLGRRDAGRASPQRRLGLRAVGEADAAAAQREGRVAGRSSAAAGISSVAESAGGGGRRRAVDGASATTKPNAKAPHPGKRGEKTADGMPKPDERTVADLVRRGWFETAEQAEAVLTKHRMANRFPIETAGPAADWLEARLASVPDKDGRCAAAQAISKFSLVLTRSVEVLQRGWNLLVRPQADGGLGYTPERATQRVSNQPQLLILLPEHVLDTAAVLEECGVAVGIRAAARYPSLLGCAATTLLERAAWWKQTGLDHKKILTAHPGLLGISSDSSNKHLQDKLDFLRDVADLSTSDLNKAAGMFGASLDDCLRPRYFYARLKGAARRYKLNTLVKRSVPAFVACVLGRGGDEATADEVARYRKLVASPKFVAWRERQEARLQLEAQRA